MVHFPKRKKKFYSGWGNRSQPFPERKDTLYTYFRVSSYPNNIDLFSFKPYFQWLP